MKTFKAAVVRILDIISSTQASISNLHLLISINSIHKLRVKYDVGVTMEVIIRVKNH